MRSQVCLSPSLFTHPLVHLLLHSADGHRLQSWPASALHQQGLDLHRDDEEAAADGGADTVARSRGWWGAQDHQLTQRPSPRAHKPGKTDSGTRALGHS